MTEQLALKSEPLTGLAADWRKLLFPDATDERFADGYAQAVTFGMLMASAKKIKLAARLQQVASELSQTSSLIGAALRFLTDNAENQATLKTSLGTLTRVLDAVNWSKISKGRPMRGSISTKIFSKFTTMNSGSKRVRITHHLK